MLEMTACRMTTCEGFDTIGRNAANDAGVKTKAAKAPARSSAAKKAATKDAKPAARKAPARKRA